jgi:hypothetical protein
VAVVGRVHLVVESRGMRISLVVRAELIRLELDVVVQREASIVSGLSAVRASPSTLASACEVGVASSAEVAARWARAALGRNDVVGVNRGQETLSAAVRRGDGFGVLGDAKLSHAANVTTILAVASPEVVANSTELGHLIFINTLAGISGVGRDGSVGLGRSDRGNFVIKTPGERHASYQVAPASDGPLVGVHDGQVTAAARIGSLPWLTVPVNTIANLRTNPPAPAVHEGIVATESRRRASQSLGQAVGVGGGLNVTKGFRKRGIFEVILEVFNGEQVASSFRASRFGTTDEGILVG